MGKKVLNLKKMKPLRRERKEGRDTEKIDSKSETEKGGESIRE